jgi:hypothetical protein
VPGEQSVEEDAYLVEGDCELDRVGEKLSEIAELTATSRGDPDIMEALYHGMSPLVNAYAGGSITSSSSDE